MGNKKKERKRESERERNKQTDRYSKRVRMNGEDLAVMIKKKYNTW